jgi:hypothetical protein
MSYTSTGGAFLPGADVTVTGLWTFSQTPTIGSGAYVTTGATQTLTSKSLTSPVITGTATGAATLAGFIEADTKVLAATATYSATTTPATLTGFSWSLIAGATYVFDINLPTTLTTVGGLTVSFKYTTLTLTSIQCQTYAATATDNSTAVSTQSTTTTDGTKFFDSKTAAYTLVTLKGSLVVNAAGTLAVQACQNTSAGSGDASLVLLGAYATMKRVL